MPEKWGSERSATMLVTFLFVCLFVFHASYFFNEYQWAFHEEVQMAFQAFLMETFPERNCHFIKDGSST